MMKHHVISQLVALVLLVLVIALAAGCGSLNAAEQKADQIEEQVETALDNQGTPSVVQNAATLTQEEAQDIALAHAGFTADQVTGLHASFEVDDGVPEYDVEFRQNGWEYSYTIHADTGDILEYDRDND